MRRFIIGILVLVVVVLLVFGAWSRARHTWPFQDAPATADITYDLSAWEWRAPTEFSTDDTREYMDFASSHSIGSIYIDVSRVVDIRELTEPEQTAKLAEFNTALKQFTQEAHRRGIAVEALAGSVQWSDPDYRYLPLQIVEFVGLYNAAATPEERLSGVQFDIESYNQKDFDTRQTKVLTDFLETAKEIQAMHNLMIPAFPNLRLGFTIPYWYDNENGNIPEVSFDGSTKPVGYHLMDVLNQQDNSYVVIMDYRDKAEGNDGSINHAKDEFVYANSRTPRVKIVIGQLLTKAEPAKTTFYKQDRSKLDEALRKLNSEFGTYDSFDGFALHDLRGYEKLDDD